MLLSENAGSGRVACGDGNHVGLRHCVRRPDDGRGGYARSAEHSYPQRGDIRHVETRCSGSAENLIPVADGSRAVHMILPARKEGYGQQKIVLVVLRPACLTRRLHSVTG